MKLLELSEIVGHLFLFEMLRVSKLFKNKGENSGQIQIPIF